MGETDLRALLRTKEPALHPEPCGFPVWDGPLPFQPLAAVAGTEGRIVAAPLALAGRGEPWAGVSLTVHSDLAAVGLTAAFTTALAGEGIICNVLAGVHHDHLFVQWDRRFDAVAALEALSRA
jgi:uncharacterized protein